MILFRNHSFRRPLTFLSSMQMSLQRASKGRKYWIKWESQCRPHFSNTIGLHVNRQEKITMVFFPSDLVTAKVAHAQPKHFVSETYQCSEYHKCMAMQHQHFQLFMIFQAAIPNHSMRWESDVIMDCNCSNQQMKIFQECGQPDSANIFKREDICHRL